MKTILVPTDFSDTSANALDYAAELAVRTQAKILLFNAYFVPVFVSEEPIFISGADMQMEEKSNKQLELIVERIKRKYEKKLTIDFLSSPGIASDEITTVAKENKCDLIVMGTKGPNSNNNFWGSHTVDVIKHTQAHVLVIPDKVKFQQIERMVLAFDYHIIKNKSVFDPLIELASLFGSEILIFNMKDGHVQSPTDTALEGIKLEQVFGNLKHTYWFYEHKNMVEAINDFADNNQSLMIAMIRRNHNIFEQIFNKSNTNLMALHSHLPLLILHE
jgi:nucleotide-binding universal stress UspA family protein